MILNSQHDQQHLRMINRDIILPPNQQNDVDLQTVNRSMMLNLQNDPPISWNHESSTNFTSKSTK